MKTQKINQFEILFDKPDFFFHFFTFNQIVLHFIYVQQKKTYISHFSTNQQFFAKRKFMLNNFCRKSKWTLNMPKKKCDYLFVDINCNFSLN